HGQVNTDNPELDHLVGLLQGEQDLAGVVVARGPAFENPNINEVAVMGLDRHGHVVFVDEQVVIRGWDLVGGEDIGARDGLVGGAKQAQQRSQVRPLGGSLSHTVSWSSCGAFGSGSGGGWRSRTLSTR